MAAGGVSAERWLASHRARKLGVLAVGTVIGVVIAVVGTLPVFPLASVHKTGAGTQVTDTIGWPQLTADVAAQDQALARAGQAPTAIYTGAYAEAGAIDTYGGGDHLPPVISAHNSFWTWGPGNASDQTVLVVDALNQVRPYFASCRQLAVFNPPDQVKSDWNDIPIGVCTGPSASWRALWPRLKHFD
jgi:hypothetical protein